MKPTETLKELTIAFIFIFLASLACHWAIVVVDERKQKNMGVEKTEDIEDLEIVKNENGIGIRIVRGKITKSPVYMFSCDPNDTYPVVICTSPTTGYIEYRSNRNEKAFKESVKVPFKITGNNIIYDLEEETNEK